MSVDMKPIHTIELDLGISSNGAKQRELTNTVYRYMYKYVPFSGDTGKVHLRENVAIGNDSITFKSVYAKRIYYGDENWNWTTPGTGPYWDEKMLSAERGDLLKEVADKWRSM